MKYYKSIEEALPILRPGDKLVKVLNNKFAFVKPVYENGKFGDERLMGLNDNTIFTYFHKAGHVRSMIKMPSIKPEMWCMDHSDNGKPYHWLIYITDNRKLRHTYRKIAKLLKIAL